MNIFAQSDDSGSDPDLVSEIGSELQVTVDRWSAGQLGLSDLAIAGAVAGGAVLLAWVVRRSLRVFTRHLEGPAAAASVVAGQLLSVAIYLFATAIVLEILGFGLGPVILVALMIVLIAVFLRPVFQNLSSGLLLQLGGLFALDDVVETNGALGVVQQFGSRTVVLSTSDGRTVHIPNREVLEQPLINYSTLGRRRSEQILRLPAGADVSAASTGVARAIAGASHVLDDPVPEVVATGFDGAQALIRALYWHDGDLPAERAARDGVARALAELVNARELTLVPESIMVRGDDPAI